MSMPASRSRCTWLIGTPSMRCMTSTSWVQSSQTISGISTSPRPSMLRRSCAAFAASRTRSSSSCRYLSNSATTWRGFSRLPSADQRSTARASWRISSTSSSIAASIPGRRTLTATSRPSRSTAKCTCAIEALATGTGSKLANTASIGSPNARSTIARATGAGNGGTRSCSLASSSAMSGGSRSRRVDSTWPNLTKIGPSRSSPSRSRTPRGASRLRPIVMQRTRKRTQRCRKLESASSSSP